MNVHVRWRAVLQRIDESKKAEDKSILTASGKNNSWSLWRIKSLGCIPIFWGIPDYFYWGIKTWEASTGEMRTRIFVLLGNNSVGRMFIPSKSSQELGLYANLLGIYGGHWMVLHRGLRLEVLDSVGGESLIFAEGLQFKVF